jgi:uncharacterized protein YjbI with pentapeptide repeats
MKPFSWVALTALSLFWIGPVHAENLEQTQQLIDTKVCQRCDLSGAGLVYTNLTGVDLTEALLTQANLSRANLSLANLQGANLAGASLFNANLTGANLSQADLQGADLRGAILTGAKIEGANLDGANLLGAIGMPSEVATPENLYLWGLSEAQRGNYRGAIENYNQVLELKPEFAHAYLARGIARFRLGDSASALTDAQQAEQLYLEQGNEAGHQASVQISDGIYATQEALEQRNRVRGGGGGGGNFLGFLGSIANLLLRFAAPQIGF